MNSPQIKCIARFPINMLSQLENFELGRIKNYSQMEMDLSPLEPHQPYQAQYSNQKILQQYQNLISPQQNVFDLNMIFKQNKFNQNKEPSLISTNDSENKKYEIEKLLNLDSNETWIDQSEYMIQLNNQPINWKNEENQESVSLGSSKVKEEELQSIKEQKEQDLFQSSQQQQFYEEEPFEGSELENNEIQCEEDILPIFDKLTDSVIKKINAYKEFDKKEMFPLKMNETEFLNDKVNGQIDYAFYKPHQNPNWNNLSANLNIMKMIRQQQQNQSQNIALLLGYQEKIKAIQQQKNQFKQEHLQSSNSYKIKRA